MENRMSAKLLNALLNVTMKKCTPTSGTIATLSYSHCAKKSAMTPPSTPVQIFKFSSDTPPKCWSCNYPFKSDLFCSKCKKLQEPPEDLNYFQIIGVEEDYDIQNTEVQQKYRRLQNLLHPDKFSNKSEEEKEISAKMSSLVNKAYSTLTHPLDRGLYILRLKDVTIPEGTTSLDPEFLMEVMEKNEQVAEASKDKQKVMELLKETRNVLEELSREVSEAFRNEDIEKAKRNLIKMKYYASIEARLKRIKEDLLIVE